MSMLILGLVIFLGVHSVSIVAPGWRDSMQAKLGEFGWKGLYSVLAIVGFVLIIEGYAAARHEPVLLYQPPLWLRHVSALLLLPVFPLLLATYLPGRIKAAAKHPMLVATKLWAFAHLLANGMLADVVLFGAFLAWAVVDRISVNRRPARPLRTAPASSANDVLAVVLGLAIYAAFTLWLHAKLIGVPPFGAIS
jgi:uncharacterized membrane protein